MFTAVTMVFRAPRHKIYLALVNTLLIFGLNLNPHYFPIDHSLLGP